MTNLFAQGACLLITIFSYVVFATEIDSFNLRDQSVEDATPQLNQMMNNYIQESINEANSWNECDEDAFAIDLHKRIGGFFWSEFENSISASTTIPWLSIARSDSVYQDFSFIYAPALYMASLGPVLHLGNFFIGSDKLGHFITEGYRYYRIIKDDQGSLEDALAFGENTERGYFGLQTTGIYSHADLVANYHGLIGLWQKLISNGQNGSDSHVVCKNRRYFLARHFDWSEHINAGWDEGINCNAYRNATLEKQAQTRISMLSMTCPIAPRECRELIPLYGDIAHRLISPKCF